MQTHPEHQQHHADFGQLVREGRVGEDAGRMLPGGDAGQQIADERGRLQEALADEAEDERQRKRDDEGRDERKTVFHVGWSKKPEGG